MAAAQLGACRCPLCGGPAARASLSKKNLAVITCQQKGCGMQLFARADDADELVRALIAAQPEPEPVRTEPPAPQEPPEPVRTEPPAPQEPPEPVRNVQPESSGFFLRW